MENNNKEYTRPTMKETGCRARTSSKAEVLPLIPPATIITRLDENSNNKNNRKDGSMCRTIIASAQFEHYR